MEEKSGVRSGRGETYAFLFDADTESFGGSYGVPCGRLLFRAVLALRPPVCVRIYSGDMMLGELCLRISAVKKAPDENRYTSQVNQGLYVSLLTELVRSIEEREPLIAVPNLALTLGRRNIFAITLCGLTDDQWKSLGPKLTGGIGLRRGWGSGVIF